MNNSKVNNLLKHFFLINEKYKHIAEQTGENFNVFEILNVSSYELKHSSFIANLLNTKERHGQKETFLKLFIDTVNEEILETKPESQFDTISIDLSLETKTFVEYFIGSISYDYKSGGRIDILIKNKKRDIIIENKLDHSDEEMQLVRYKNFNGNAALLYLTYNGVDATVFSKGHLKKNIDYFCISYEKTIKKWIEKCVKEMYNKPFIRETLIQYLHLIKELTNQSNNKIMINEIYNAVVATEENLDSFFELTKNVGEIKFKLLKDNFYMNILKEIEVRYELEIEISEEFYSGIATHGISITNSMLKEKNLYVIINFEGSNFTRPLFGIGYNSADLIDENTNGIIKKKFERKFGNFQSSDSFLCYLENSDYTKEFDGIGNNEKLIALKFNYIFVNNLQRELDFIIKELLEIVVLCK